MLWSSQVTKQLHTRSISNIIVLTRLYSVCMDKASTLHLLPLIPIIRVERWYLSRTRVRSSTPIMTLHWYYDCIKWHVDTHCSHPIALSIEAIFLFQEELPARKSNLFWFTLLATSKRKCTHTKACMLIHCHVRVYTVQIRKGQREHH